MNLPLLPDTPDHKYEGFVDWKKFRTDGAYNPADCVELEIYDNDGPEGHFHRICFERSYQAVRYIVSKYMSQPDFENYNFKITNHWKTK